jgi:hypothetical protein
MACFHSTKTNETPDTLCQLQQSNSSLHGTTQFVQIKSPRVTLRVLELLDQSYRDGIYREGLTMQAAIGCIEGRQADPFLD